MTLLWKLLRQHISIAQFVGFFFANLLGMFIVLFGFQLAHDDIVALHKAIALREDGKHIAIKLKAKQNDKHA